MCKLFPLKVVKSLHLDNQKTIKYQHMLLTFSGLKRL